MRSVNARSIAEFCARQDESRSCALMRGIVLWCVEGIVQDRRAARHIRVYRGLTKVYDHPPNFDLTVSLPSLRAQQGGLFPGVSWALCAPGDLYVLLGLPKGHHLCFHR